MGTPTAALLISSVLGEVEPTDWSGEPTWKWPTELSRPPKGIGVGLDFRNPGAMGLSFAYLTEQSMSVLHFSPFFEQEFYSAAHLIRLMSASDHRPTEFPLYLGLGFWSWKEAPLPQYFGLYPIRDAWGAQLPMVIQVEDQRASLDLYFDITPALWIQPYVKLDVYVGAGIRVYGLHHVVRAKQEIWKEWRAFERDKKNPPEDTEGLDFDR